jgi:hypothetical protein
MIKLRHLSANSTMDLITILRLNLFEIYDQLPYQVSNLLPGQCRVRDDNMGFYINNMIFVELWER